MSDYQIKYQEIKGSLVLLLQQNNLLKQQLKEANESVLEKQYLKESWTKEVQKVQNTINQLSYDNQNFQQENEQLIKNCQEFSYLIQQQVDQIITLKEQNEKLIIQLDQSRQSDLQKDTTIKQQKEEFNKQLALQQSQHFDEIKKIQSIIENQSQLIKSFEKLNEIEKLDTQNSFYQQQMVVEDQMMELRNRNIILTNKINEEKQKYDQLFKQHKDEILKLQGVIKDQKELSVQIQPSQTQPLFTQATYSHHTYNEPMNTNIIYTQPISHRQPKTFFTNNKINHQLQQQQLQERENLYQKNSFHIDKNDYQRTGVEFQEQFLFKFKNVIGRMEDKLLQMQSELNISDVSDKPRKLK